MKKTIDSLVSMKFRKLYITIIIALFSLDMVAQSIYQGKLGGKYGVVIQLIRGEKRGNITEMEGAYYYTSKGPDNLIYLSGTWNRSNQDFEIEEYEDGIPVGMFKGKFTNYGMEGVHTNYARNSKLNFKLKRTQSASQSSRQSANKWKIGYLKDEFGDTSNVAAAVNQIQGQYEAILYFLYNSDVGLEISSDEEDLNKYTRISLKRSNGKIERLHCRSYGNKLYVDNRDEIKKIAQIMDEGNFKLLIEYLRILDESTEYSRIFNVKKELVGAQDTFNAVDTENSKR